MHYCTLTLAEAVFIGDRLVDTWSQAAEITDEVRDQLKHTGDFIKYQGPKGQMVIGWNHDTNMWLSRYIYE